MTGVWMGYDDNSPLTGVTGGGLPAEIWQETMTRVQDGLPVRDLPMQRPKAPTPEIESHFEDHFGHHFTCFFKFFA